MPDIKVPERAEYLRVIMAEFTRIVNHYFALGQLLSDMGAFFTPMLYGIEDSGLRTIFVDRDRLERLGPYLDNRALDLIAVRTQHAAGRGVRQWSDFIQSGTGVMHVPEIDPDEVLILVMAALGIG